MWAQLGLMGLSALGGLFGGRPRTTTTETNETSSGSRTDSASSRRFMTPEQQAAMQLLMGFGGQQLMDPGAGLDGVLQTQRNRVNSMYAGAGQRIADATLQHGGASSGKFDRALRQMEAERLGSLAQVEAQRPGLMMDRQQQAAQLLMALTGMQMGSDETGRSDFSEQRNSRSTQRGNSNMLGGAFGSALSGFGYLGQRGGWFEPSNPNRGRV